MEFGEKLKAARIRSGMTQDTVAKQIGVSRQSLSNWENDRTYPDLASVLKLSDLYGLSLDDLLREDMELRRKIEQRKENIKTWCSWLHDLAMLLLGSTIWLDWLEKEKLAIVLGVAGILLICLVHCLLVFRLGADGRAMALRCVAMVLWFGGLLLRILYGHTHVAGNVLWFGGMLLYWHGSYSEKWTEQYPRHMTAFTGFVFAMVLVFGTIPFAGDSVKRGDHIESNPFNSRDYRVTEVLAGDERRIPMVYLGSTSSAYLDYPGMEEQRLDGKFTYITQPEGAKTKGVWELIEGEKLYRVALEADDSVTMACWENGEERWKYCLEPAPTMGCTILDVLGSTIASAEWYYADSFDDTELSGGLHLRGKGTVKLSVPGDSPTVTIYEEFRDGGSVEYQTMILERDKRGFVEFYRETRKDGGKQTGIYRIPYQDGEFVLGLQFMK